MENTQSFNKPSKIKLDFKNYPRNIINDINILKKLNVNFYENLSINKEAYELEREALLSAGAQATAAGAESERGAAAVAGRVLAAQNQAQAQDRVAMSTEQKELEALIAKEDSRLRDVQGQLDLEEVALM